MCGGGGSSKPAPKPVTPTYSYFPESARTQQQQVAAQTPNTQASYGAELASGATAPAAAPTTTGG
jgi:hypothetical protein